MPSPWHQCRPAGTTASTLPFLRAAGNDLDITEVLASEVLAKTLSEHRLFGTRFVPSRLLRSVTLQPDLTHTRNLKEQPMPAHLELAKDGAKLGAWSGGILGLLVGAGVLPTAGILPAIAAGSAFVLVPALLIGITGGATLGGLVGAIAGIGSVFRQRQSNSGMQVRS
jgi:hypothetical protein